MRSLDYYIASSVDGVIARADGSFDFFLTEGPHIADYLAALGAFDAVLMGRKTYEVGTKVGVTDPYPALQTYVVSRSLPDSAEPNVTVIRDKVSDTVRSLKAGDGRGIYLCGGSELAAALLADGLVDYVTVKINPVLVGSGISLVGALPRAIDLTLVDHTIYANGVVVLRYQVKPASPTG